MPAIEKLTLPREHSQHVRASLAGSVLSLAPIFGTTLTVDAPLAKENLFAKLACFVHEVFAVLFLDSQHPSSDRLHLDVRRHR